MAKKIGHFEIHRAKDGVSYYFKLIAANCEEIIISQMYTTKQACKNGIKSVAINSDGEVLDKSKKIKTKK